jgi:hypothetical protein
LRRRAAYSPAGDTPALLLRRHWPDKGAPMSSILIDRLGGSALTLAIELFLIWKIWSSLRKGVVEINFDRSNNINNNSILDITASRASLPTLYWVMVGLLVVSAVFVGAVFIFIAAGGVH